MQSSLSSCSHVSPAYDKYLELYSQLQDSKGRFGSVFHDLVEALSTSTSTRAPSLPSIPEADEEREVELQHSTTGSPSPNGLYQLGQTDLQPWSTVPRSHSDVRTRKTLALEARMAVTRFLDVLSRSRDLAEDLEIGEDVEALEEMSTVVTDVSTLLSRNSDDFIVPQIGMMDELHKLIKRCNELDE